MSKGVPDRAWIVGATSFLGCHVAKELSRRGCEVTGFAHRPMAADKVSAWGFAAVETGSLEMSAFDRVCVRRGVPSLVFHAVGSGSVAQAQADPARDEEGTLGTLRRLLDAMSRIAPDARLVYPSSASVYGSVSAGPIREDAPLQPISVYGKNKLRAEEMCREQALRKGLDAVILRCFSVYGVPQRKLLFWDLGRRLRAGQRVVTLGGTGEETRDFIQVCDVAAIVAALAAVSEPPRTVNVGTGRALSVAAVAALFVKAMNVAGDIEFDGASRAGDPPHLEADTTLLASLGWKSFIPLADGLAEYAAWLAKDPLQA